MLFYSPRFLVFLFALLLVLSVPMGHATKKRALAAASCLFYAAWDYRYLGLLLLVSAIDYACAARIGRSADDRVRRRYLAFSVVSNLGILAYFKYANFFVSNLDLLLPSGARLPRLDVLLPVGISFYTFKSISYTIDVFRREIRPCDAWMDYVTFVTFFPELIAGPIVRASVFLPQMTRPIGPTRAGLEHGFSLFLLGLTKKIVVADTLARFADTVFDRPESFAARSLWAALLSYALQIYCDFSGYSDMAIGTAKMIGYDLPENFDRPYLSRSPAEFWRRWHITLSQWLRDYLYIPLGGNRKGPIRTYANLFATMLLGGLWHGASWNFVAWGAMHGAALALHRLWTARRLPAPPRIVQRPLMFAFVALAWVPFRASTAGASLTIFKGLAGAGAGRVTYVPAMLFVLAPLVVAGHLVLLALRDDRWRAPVLRLRGALDLRMVRDPISGSYVTLGASTVAGSFLIVAWLLVIVSLGTFTSHPFIYFQF
jgi:alginate O-acetyltransferase complex protein AlgI